MPVTACEFESHPMHKEISSKRGCLFFFFTMVYDLYILMITAGVVSLLFKLLKQPVVLGYIVIIAALGSKLGVTDPAIYPIIVASSVLTTFLTPYIMKTTVPCYNFLYKHASPSFRSKIDKREQDVEQAEK